MSNGTTLVGAAIAGTGSTIDFGNQTAAGSYTVIATDATYGCISTMTGSPVISIIPAPSSSYSVDGGGAFCAGGTGVNVGLSNSDIGVIYQLTLAGSAVGSSFAGTGSLIDFGLITSGGTYTVVATDNTTGCTSVMSGSSVVTVNSLPALIPVIGGGPYCSGGSGSDISLSGSATGINYQLYNGSAPVISVAGTGSALDFGYQAATGVYHVIATDAVTLCSSTMTGTTVISINPLPSVYSVSGGGSLCAGGAGVDVSMSSSDNDINYQLFVGSLPVGLPVPGTGATLDFGLQTSSGIYTVSATDASTGCTTTMYGSPSVTTMPLPAQYNVTGGGIYCAGSAGVNIGIDNSDLGISYTLYNGSTPFAGPLTGTGSPLDFGIIASNGTYSVIATDLSTSCTNNMNGSAVVSESSFPLLFNVTGGGSYCSGGTGVSVGLNSSENTVSYQLFVGSNPVGSAIPGTGSSLDLGLQITLGIYTITATTTGTACSDNMSGTATITINSLPAVYTVTGGGSYCAGGAGIDIGLTNSDPGTSYYLYLGGSLAGAVSGTGSSLDFGLNSSAGTYNVTATNTLTGCNGTMSGSASIAINPLPVVFNLTGGGSFCVGGSGKDIFLSGSETGVTYTLLGSGIAAAAPVSGSGTLFEFTGITSPDSYTVSAVTSDGCSDVMSGSAVISTIPLPALYTVTGGGGYCAGGTGVAIGLNGSDPGVSYLLYIGGTFSSLLPGTGSALNFGLMTIPGSYTILANNISTNCSAYMTGSPSVNINPVPATYNITGGGNYCSGGSGVSVGLDNSDVSVKYQLYNGIAPLGTLIAGTGSAIDFGSQTLAGNYSVVAADAITGCSDNMNGTASVLIDPKPVAFSVTGGGGICPAGPGVNIGISGSALGVNYQLYLAGIPSGSPVAGNDFALNFGPHSVAGSYSVIATNTTTGCFNNMAGSALITINPVPSVYPVTGGGSFCSGGAGINIGLSGSDPGTGYQLFIGSVPYGLFITGTGSAINFGMQTTPGTYSIMATNESSGCVLNMPGVTTINLNPPPALHVVTGGGAFCSGGSGINVGLNGSEIGISYQLFNGSLASGAPVYGTGSSLDFGLQTATGSYQVVATSGSTGCTIGMTGLASITLSPAPVTYNVTGSGGYCPSGSGLHVALDGSATGVNYQLYSSGLAVGASISGNGLPLDFGVYSAGIYTVVATNTTTSCTGNMSGNAAIFVNPLPVSFTITGGGSYCAGGAGQHITLAGSQSGVAYQLFTGGVATGSSLTGTGFGLDFGLNTSIGSYTVVATDLTTGCNNPMSGSAMISISAGPAAFAVGGGGSYCVSGSGEHVYLSSSNSGINYQLYNGSTAITTSLSGTGSGLDFGLQVLPGTYTITGTDAVTGCSSVMSGSAAISTLPVPVPYGVSGGGNYCAGASGVHVSITGSALGVSYQLYNGGVMAGPSASGTGGSLDFGLKSATGLYTVVATSTATGCSGNMSGSVSIGVNPLPDVFTVTASGSSYCIGGTGVSFSLSGSQSGTIYQLYVGSSAAGSSVTGTLSSVSFGLQTAPGAYHAIATNPVTGCTADMSGTLSVAVNPLPVVYTVTGGGGYCSDGPGSHIGISGSASGISYQLYHSGLLIGSPVSGTGSALDMGLQTLTGSYTVVATNAGTSCSSNMAGIATVAVNPLPAAYTVTGGGSFCAGGSGVHVNLVGSSSGISYQLFKGSVSVGAPVFGSGMPLDFGLQNNAGMYTVVATNESTGCQSNMSGAASVSTVALPLPYTVIGGGPFCSGGAGLHVGISGSAPAVNYQLYNGSTPVGSLVSGTGTLVDFGLQSAAGVYTVIATDPSTSCNSTMPGSAVLSLSSSPDVFTVTGGGDFCTGSAGIHVGIAGSESGISYNLIAGGSVMATAGGTGTAIDFGPQSITGAYVVLASDVTTGCSAEMDGTASVNALPLVTPSVSIAAGTGLSFCSGAYTTFSAIPVNGGSSPAYQWTVNGVLTGSGSSYSYIPLDGDVIAVSLTSAAACATPVLVNSSAALTVLVSQTPSVAVSANPGTEVCQGNSVTYSAFPTFGGSAPLYEWQVNGLPAGSGVDYTYTPANGDIVTCTLASNYQCRTANTATSIPVNMVVDLPVLPVVTITASPGLSIAEGETETLNAEVLYGGLAPVYQWQINGVNIPGAVYQSYASSDFANGDVVSCNVISSGSCAGKTGSSTVTINVSNVGVKTISAGSGTVSVIPNPNNGLFSITGMIGTGNEEVVIEVSNMLGQEIYNAKSALLNGKINEKVQLGSDIINGMYIVTLRTGEESRILHVVVAH